MRAKSAIRARLNIFVIDVCENLTTRGENTPMPRRALYTLPEMVQRAEYSAAGAAKHLSIFVGVIRINNRLAVTTGTGEFLGH